MTTPWRKISLLGDEGVGKTSLARRFAYNVVYPHYAPSTGVTVSSKTVVVARLGVPAAVTLLLWDPASPLRGGSPPEGFLSGADAVLLVCDTSRSDPLKHIGAFVEQARRFAPSAVLTLVVNKVDLASSHACLSMDAHTLAQAFHASLFFVSAHSNSNVERTFRTVASQALSMQLERDRER